MPSFVRICTRRSSIDSIERPSVSAHFNKANELLARDTDNSTSSADNYTLAYNEVGNLIDDGKDYEYVYDAFGRLRKVLNTSNQALVAEYWYNPQGHRITWHFDTTQNGGGAPDGTVDADDPKFHLIYNERWQHVATYRQEDGDPIDSDPKEQFLYHTAGLAGYGSSSYIDAVILRDDEFDGGEWPEEADATLDRRVYYCQNWRADVVAILAANGRLIERAWYEPYGTPHGSTSGDFTGSTTGADDHYLVPNGIVDGDDQTVFTTLFNAPDDLADMTGSSDPGHADYGRPDGTIDASDLFFWLDCNASADDLGRNVLSEGHTGASLGTFSVRNRKGLAGYEWDPAIRKYHVRNRVLDPDTGRWTRRDPLGYVDGASLVEYVSSMPLRHTDSSGLCTQCPSANNAVISGILDMIPIVAQAGAEVECDLCINVPLTHAPAIVQFCGGARVAASCTKCECVGADGKSCSAIACVEKWCLFGALRVRAKWHLNYKLKKFDCHATPFSGFSVDGWDGLPGRPRECRPSRCQLTGDVCIGFNAGPVACNFCYTGISCRFNLLDMDVSAQFEFEVCKTCYRSEFFDCWCWYEK